MCNISAHTPFATRNNIQPGHSLPVKPSRGGGDSVAKDPLLQPPTNTLPIATHALRHASANTPECGSPDRAGLPHFLDGSPPFLQRQPTSSHPHPWKMDHLPPPLKEVSQGLQGLQWDMLLKQG